VIPTLKSSVPGVLCAEVLMNVGKDSYEIVVEPFVIAVGFK
jgi:hypothetical protein